MSLKNRFSTVCGDFACRSPLFAAIVLAVLSAAASPAAACSVDDNNYLEAFLDASCVQSQTNTTLDAQGGVRLTTNGAPVADSWDTNGDFDSGITYQSVSFPPVGVSSLARSGTGSAATLGLATSSLPLQRGGSAVLSPPIAGAGDNDGVEDPSVIKVGSTYVMYYTGTAEDGSAPQIFQATSPDGSTWTRANGGAPVLSPTVGAFDEFGVQGPEVVHDAADAVTPYRMWYAGQGSTFGAIGYATSTDGVSWTKHTDGGPLPVPVLDHGLPGSADSFAAADPSVIKDGSTWKMWYTGDDSSKKRIAYAASPDGVVWGKGGSVIAPEDPGVSANLEFGAFAPTVWKSGANSYRMLLAGRKIVSGSTFQTKILDSSSSDGITWAGPSPSINPSGSNSNFDYSNLDGPDVLADPGAPVPYKAYYAGNTLDANGNFHTRIGYATSGNGSAFSKVAGSGVGGSALDVSALGTAFDARSVGGLSAAVPSGAPAGQKFVGFYGGVRGSDFKWRIGAAYSPDGAAWTRFGDGAQTGGSLLPLGNTPANFDLGGQRDPNVMYDSAAGSPYRLYFTALTTGGAMSIGTSATTQDLNKQPVNSSWATPTRVLVAGAGFDSGGVAHPSVIKDGATYRMYYTAIDSGGASTIGYTTSASATAFAGAHTQVLTAGSGFDAAGAADPVVWMAGAGDYRMIYTGLANENGVVVRRLGYATSPDGATWTKASPALLLNPSATPFAFDETGVSAAGVALDGATPHVWFAGADRSGRTRAGHATSSGSSTIPDGWATYQLGDATTTVRDFRQITRTSSGAVTLWMSFLQPYSTSGAPYWSEYFPVTASSASEALNFLLTIRGVRWQVRMNNPASTPTLDAVSISHAPVSFNATGTLMTDAIAPPVGLSVGNWNSAVLDTALFQPSGGGAASATVRVLDATSGVQVATGALNTGGETTVDLSSVSVANHPELRVALDLASADGQASPLVSSLQVTYNKAAAPVLTLAAGAASTIYGTPVTLTGRLTQGGTPLAGRTVTIAGTPAGGATSSVATGVTDAAGNFVIPVTPDRQTGYVARFGSTASGGVSVAVAERVRLKVRRKGTKGYAKGDVGPLHAGQAVQLQQKKGSRWVTIKKLKASSKSTFAYTVRKLKPKGKYQFRAKTPGDATHLPGMSPVYYVDAIKLTLSIARSGRTLTFSGKASPAHPRKSLVIKVLKGTTWSTFAKLKLSSRSTFTLKKKVAAGSYSYRAEIGGDTDHWPGKSSVKVIVVP